jgi:hypothetical protein
MLRYQEQERESLLLARYLSSEKGRELDSDVGSVARYQALEEVGQSPEKEVATWVRMPEGVATPALVVERSVAAMSVLREPRRLSASVQSDSTVDPLLVQQLPAWHNAG